MWEQEGRRYWQRKQRRRQCWAIAALCTLLLVAAGWYGWQVALPAYRARIAQEAASVAAAPPQTQTATTRTPRVPTGRQLAACRGRKTEPLFCHDRCAPSMHLAPRPFTYRACLAGCTQSVQQGLQRGCTSNAIRSEDFDCETFGCTEVCAEWQAKDPKGRTVRQCTESCRNSHIAACKESVSFLQALVKDSGEL